MSGCNVYCNITVYNTYTINCRLVDNINAYNYLDIAKAATLQDPILGVRTNL